MRGLHGTLPAPVTPFTEKGASVDADWIPLHLEYLPRRGVDGVVIMGTTGEGPSLALTERKLVIDTVMAHRDDLPVVVGTGCAALPETIEISRYAIEAGADAILVVPPFYFKEVPSQGLWHYYAALLEALPPDSRLILYNIPDTSGVAITDELVDALIERYPERVFGIKDTSGRLEQTEHYLNRYPQLAIYSGSDGLVAASCQAGAKGAISAVANVFPELVSAVQRACLEKGDVEAAQERVNRVRTLLKKFPSRSAIKHLLHLVGGLPLTYVRPPLEDLSPEQMEELKRDLSALEIGS